MHPIISIKNLSKQYRLGTVGTGTLSNDLKRWWYNVRGKEDPFLKIGETNVRSSKGTSDYVWALKDISFDVMPGEVLGIIGKNGAGKSTLLKILSKVTGPTTGSIDYNGRIGSLLEVGTGFHPELTGRENIFLNGAILGMTKTEIRSKLDEIVDFSGCERYIDTPVKRYSSGMMVRLGFAVAAHLEPEILVVDEVLAVGDAEFQKKAIGKMQDVSRNDGRTVLFVSHNMTSISHICTNALLLSDGLVYMKSDTKTIIREYFDNNNSSQPNIYINNDADKDIFVKTLTVYNGSGVLQDSFSYDDEIVIDLKVFSRIDYGQLGIGIRFSNNEGIAVFSTCNYDKERKLTSINKGIWHYQVKIPSYFLIPGRYYLDIGVFKPGEILFDHIDNKISVTINELNYLGNIMKDDRKGLVAPIFEWKTSKVE